MTVIPRSPLTWRKKDALETSETSDLASKTVPDQALSLKELITRHTRGIPIPTFRPVYDGDLNMPDISRMTAIELQDYYEDLQSYIDEHKPLIEQILLEQENPDPDPDPTPSEETEA